MPLIAQVGEAAIFFEVTRHRVTDGRCVRGVVAERCVAMLGLSGR